VIERRGDGEMGRWGDGEKRRQGERETGEKWKFENSTI